MIRIVTEYFSNNNAVRVSSLITTKNINVTLTKHDQHKYRFSTPVKNTFALKKESVMFTLGWFSPAGLGVESFVSGVIIRNHTVRP